MSPSSHQHWHLILHETALGTVVDRYPTEAAARSVVEASHRRFRGTAFASSDVVACSGDCDRTVRRAKVRHEREKGPLNA